MNVVYPEKFPTIDSSIHEKSKKKENSKHKINIEKVFKTTQKILYPFAF